MPRPETIAGPASLAASPRWSAPLWLRLLVLAGLGVVLGLPFLFSGAQRLMWGESREATRTARQFLAVLLGETKFDPNLLSPQAPRTPAPASSVTAAWGTTLGSYITVDTEPARVKGESADVGFTLRFDGEGLKASSLPKTPSGALAQDEVARKSQERLAGLARQWDGTTGSVHLKRVEKKWRVRALTVSQFPGGPAILIDFEKGPENTPPKATGFEPLAPVSREEFEAAWQVDLDVQEKPALEVLQTLVNGFQTRKTLVCPDDARAAASREVSLRMQRRPRLEAIEEVCRQVGLQPVYQPGSIHLTTGPRASLLAVTGPFVVRVQNVTQSPPNAIGTLTLSCMAPDLPVTVATLLGAELPACRDVSVTTADGRNLYHAEKQPYHPPRASFSGPDTWGVHWELPLKNLLSDLTTVPETRGSCRVRLPSRVDVIGFESLTVGETRSAEDTQVTLRKFGQIGRDVPGPALPGMSQLEFECHGGARQWVQWKAIGSAGNESGNGGTALDSSGRFRVVSAGEPTSCQFLLFTLGEEVVFDFVLRDIPLPGRLLPGWSRRGSRAMTPRWPSPSQSSIRPRASSPTCTCNSVTTHKRTSSASPSNAFIWTKTGTG